jgi:hypothetical protein
MLTLYFAKLDGPDGRLGDSHARLYRPRDVSARGRREGKQAADEVGTLKADVVVLLEPRLGIFGT